MESTSVACNQITGPAHGHSTLWAPCWIPSKFCHLLTRRYNTHIAGSKREGFVSWSQVTPRPQFLEPSSDPNLPRAASLFFTGAADIKMLHTQQKLWRTCELYLSSPDNTQTQSPSSGWPRGVQLPVLFYRAWTEQLMAQQAQNHSHGQSLFPQLYFWVTTGAY